MDLYYLIEEEKKKKRVIRLADISAVNRCSDEAVTDSSVIPNVIGTAALETTSSSQASQVRAVLVTTSGDVLNGDLTDNQIMWQTNYGEITFRPEDIKLIVLQCGPDQTGLLETFSGDRLRGAIGDQPVAVRLSTGQTLSVPAKQIKFMDRSADNQEIAVHCNNEQD
jgi:hypothetical protein